MTPEQVRQISYSLNAIAIVIFFVGIPVLITLVLFADRVLDKLNQILEKLK